MAQQAICAHDPVPFLVVTANLPWHRPRAATVTPGHVSVYSQDTQNRCDRVGPGTTARQDKGPAVKHKVRKGGRENIDYAESIV